MERKLVVLKQPEPKREPTWRDEKRRREKLYARRATEHAKARKEAQLKLEAFMRWIDAKQA